MVENFHKPTQYSGDKFDTFEGGQDPAQIVRAAHDTAHALIEGARAAKDPAVLDRIVAYTDEHGIDALAELWSRSSAGSLPGALWRIYLLRAVIQQDAVGTSLLFQRGTDTLTTIDAAVTGAVNPTGPHEIKDLTDQILRGLFRGDFGVALDRASSFSRILASGASSIADDQELLNPERASELTIRADRYSRMGAEFTSCAKLFRSGTLD